MIRMKTPVLRFGVLSLFPKTIEGFTEESILGKAIDRGLLEINSLDLRRWAEESIARQMAGLLVVASWGWCLNPSLCLMPLMKFPTNRLLLFIWLLMVRLYPLPLLVDSRFSASAADQWSL